MLFAIMSSFVLSFCFCPAIIKICEKLNWYDEIDPRKIHTGKIPRLGGVALFTAFLISWICAHFLVLSTGVRFYAPLFAGFGIIMLFGVIDDIFNLRAKLKFLIQMIAALVVSFSPYHFGTLFMWKFPPFVGEILTFFWIISIVNAFNLIDGMDWLCGGISFLTCLTLAFIFKAGNNNIFLFYFMLCGSIAGFLFWNKPNAKIFLGDGGSQTLGYLIAIAPLFYKGNPRFEFTQFPMMILLCSIPITDVIAAIWRRRREHRSFFSADRAHIHHKLLNVGFSKLAAIFFLLAVQFFICFSAFVSYFMSIRGAIVLLGFSLVFVWGIFITFHYLNRSVNLAHRGLLSENPMKY